jgi:hypothetical protein
MPRDEVLGLKPGRELDALIAEKVMGFRCVVDKGNGNVSWIAYGVYGETHTPPMAWKKWNYKVPPYSTDIAAAWEVVEKMSEQWPQYQLAKIEDGWSVMWGFDGYGWPEATGKTAPEAICKAALLAVMDIE